MDHDELSTTFHYCFLDCTNSLLRRYHDSGVIFCFYSLLVQQSLFLYFLPFRFLWEWRIMALRESHGGSLAAAKLLVCILLFAVMDWVGGEDP